MAAPPVCCASARDAAAAVAAAAVVSSVRLVESMVRSGRLDVRALDVIEVLALDPHQLREAASVGRVNRADVVEVAVARLHQVGLVGLDQNRRVTLAALDD